MAAEALKNSIVPANAEPLGAEEFSALMRTLGFSSPVPLAVAVSGGPDSMALALCAKRWASSVKLVAFIVDHALRAESAAEAASTQAALRVIGIEAHILRWQHPPLATRLQDRARKARYALLAEACHAHGLPYLLVAHQQEDQAETILMRLAKGSGIDGLAGMPARKDIDGVDILRPLLAIPRARLAATCHAAGISYVTDPSNRAARFARGRLRHVLPLLAEEGLTIERLIDLGRRAADAKDALDHATSLLLRVGTHRDIGGAIHFDLEHLRSAPRAVALRAVARCLHAIHPADYAPEHAALARLTDALRRDQEMPAATLHGCLIGKAAHKASFMREYAGISDMPAIAPGESLIWDNRWRIALAPDSPHTFEVRALGNPPHERLEKLAPDLRKKVPQGRARAGMPALWLNGGLAIIPDFSCLCGAPAGARLVAAWPGATAG